MDPKVESFVNENCPHVSESCNCYEVAEALVTVVVSATVPESEAGSCRADMVRAAADYDSYFASDTQRPASSVEAIDWCRTRIQCSVCEGHGWIESERDDGRVEVQRCDSCFRFKTDAEARAAAADDA